MGIFDAFIDDARRAADWRRGRRRGRSSRGRHAARFAGGSAGVLQGTRTFVLQDDDGNIELTHSISAGLDYAAVGPEHAWLRALGRAEYAHVGDEEALDAFQTLARLEGILPALESAHAIAYARTLARELGPAAIAARQPVGPRRQGRADGGEALAVPGRTTMSRLAADRSRQLARRRERPGLVTYTTAGDPDLPRSAEILKALDRAGADVLEVGVPFSDPLADGPVIQRATERALAAGGSLRASLAMIAAVRADVDGADRHLQLREPAAADGARRVRARRRPTAGVDGVLALDLPIEEAGEFRETLAAAGHRHDLSAQPDDDRRADCDGRRSWAAGFSTASRGWASPARARQVAAGAEAMVRRIRAHTAMPIALGFGISTPGARRRSLRATRTRRWSAARWCR